MTVELCLRNRQRTRPVDLRLLRRIVRALLADHFRTSQVELCVHLVAAPEMARLNETFLGHRGSTDVITFDYSNAGQTSGLSREGFVPGAPPAAPPLPYNFEPWHVRQGAHSALSGEIFISLDDAVAQARQFRTTWPAELVRYLVHGLLHLQGFDDLNPVARRKMKAEENCWLRKLAARFALSKLARPDSQSPIANRKSR